MPHWTTDEGRCSDCNLHPNDPGHKPSCIFGLTSKSPLVVPPGSRLTPYQQAKLAPHIRRRCVADLGAGDLIETEALLGLGAAHVVAVDKAEMPRIKTTSKVTYQQYYFARCPPLALRSVNAAFLSWPVNYPCGLAELIEPVPVVIYLGSNQNGSACGDRSLWLHLKRRNVLLHVPDRRNTLIVYGSRLDQRRHLLPEEHAVLVAPNQVMMFDGAPEAASRNDDVFFGY